MTIAKLCSELAKLEKTKSQAKIQAIRSIVGHLSDILHDDRNELGAPTYYELLENGKRRAKRKKKCLAK